MLQPGPGILLIAEPFLKDPNFSRTVVFICDHHEQGSFGFVLNREYGHTIHFLHQYPDLIEGSYEILNGIYWGGDFELAIDLLKKGHIDASRIRFYIGYSGWSEGQLKEEMNQKSWLTLEATRKLVFHRNIDEIWKDAVKSLGGDYSIMVNFPTDPQLN